MNTALIPLRNRSGQVVAHAQVDAEDAERLAGYRYHRFTRRGTAAARTVDRGKKVFLHHDVIGRPPEGLEVDHINGDPLDNRKANLRTVRHAENQQNRLGGYGESGYRNVYKHPDEGRRKCWQAKVKINGRSRSLGYFETAEEANEVATTWRLEHMPFAVR